MSRLSVFHVAAAAVSDETNMDDCDLGRSLLKFDKLDKTQITT